MCCAGTEEDMEHLLESLLAHAAGSPACTPGLCSGAGRCLGCWAGSEEDQEHLLNSLQAHARAAQPAREAHAHAQGEDGAWRASEPLEAPRSSTALWAGPCMQALPAVRNKGLVVVG